MRVVHIGDLRSSLAQPEYAGSIGVVEICGGEGGVGKLCVRSRWTRGANFDLVTWFDLIEAKHQNELLKYIEQFQPPAIILRPPCTAFGLGCHLNRYIHTGTWSRSRKIGDCLVEFAAQLCRIQFGANRHFLAENPASSELFGLQCSSATGGTGKVVKINGPQSAFGLVVDGQPIYKNITLLAGSTLPIEPFKCYNSTCRCHGTLEGRSGSISKFKLA